MKKKQTCCNLERLQTKIFLIMKLTIVLTLVCIFAAHAGSYSQGTKLNLSIPEASIVQVLKEIENQSGFYFFYNEEELKQQKAVELNVENVSVQQALDLILKNTDLTYRMIDRYILISKKEQSGLTGQQQVLRTVSGKVTDKDNHVLPGVTIVVKGSTRGTVTGSDGTYTLSRVSPDDVLLFSFVGMRTQEIAVNDRVRIDVVLEEETIGIEEVVAIGYGTMRKSDLTGSVVSVKPESINKFPTSNVTEMLRGQAPGIQVSLNDPSPGGASSILIRGNRSLSSSQVPLYIVDGMIVPHINDLNSADVESIEILKDASSQAIYGSRASNGVILISTRRGKDGKIKVELNSYVGFQQFQRNFSLYSPEEWADLRFWAKYNDGNAGIGTPDQINYETVIDDAIMYESYMNKNYTDWEKLMLGNAFQQKYDLNVQGGTEKVRFSTGFGYYNQDGVVENSGYERGTFRLNTDFVVTGWMDMGTNIAYTRSEKQSTDDNFNQFITMPPLAQAYDAEGNLRREATNAGDINPLWRIRNYNNKQQDEYLMLSSFATIRPFKGFSYKISANIRTNNRETGEYRTKLYPASTGEGFINSFKRSGWLVDQVINYQLPIVDRDHQVTLTLVQSAEEDVQKTTGFDFLNSTTDMFRWNVAGDAEVSDATRSIIRTKSLSYAARIHYSLFNKYMFTASFRRDGASVFGKENKWASFPSAAFAWRINEEQFLREVDWLDMLKLRVSYGVVGNWAIPAYRTLGLSNSYEYLFGNGLSVGYLPDSQLQNQALKWETTGSFNLGLDFSAYGGRLNASVEYYNTGTKDLLVQRTIPSITGYNTMWDNLGKTESRGWEASVDGRVVDKKNLTISLGANFSRQKNKIVKIDGRTDEEGNPINDINNNWFIGKSIHVLYNYVFDGIWQEGETVTENDYLPGDAAPTPGNVKIADYNGDGKITTDDRKIFNLDPKWYGSFNVNLLFRGIDLFLDFYTVQGVQKNNNYLYFYNSGGSLNGKLNGMKVNYWTPENRSNEAPRPQFTAAVPYFDLIGIQDASYFRLRTATLGYTIPRSLISRIGLNRLRLYMTGTNLFTVTKYKSYSPETTPGTYPEAQTFTLGLNLTF
jgi:TonB-linked SusC/RagA family outer membrane protein